MRTVASVVSVLIITACTDPASTEVGSINQASNQTICPSYDCILPDFNASYPISDMFMSNLQHDMTILPDMVHVPDLAPIPDLVNVPDIAHVCGNHVCEVTESNTCCEDCACGRGFYCPGCLQQQFCAGGRICQTSVWCSAAMNDVNNNGVAYPIALAEITRQSSKDLLTAIWNCCGGQAPFGFVCGINNAQCGNAFQACNTDIP